MTFGISTVYLTLNYKILMKKVVEMKFGSPGSFNLQKMDIGWLSPPSPTGLSGVYKYWLYIKHWYIYFGFFWYKYTCIYNLLVINK